MQKYWLSCSKIDVGSECSKAYSCSIRAICELECTMDAVKSNTNRMYLIALPCYLGKACFRLVAVASIYVASTISGAWNTRIDTIRTPNVLQHGFICWGWTSVCVCGWKADFARPDAHGITTRIIDLGVRNALIAHRIATSITRLNCYCRCGRAIRNSQIATARFI